MGPQFEHRFEWDPVKALRNIREHKVSFERAATVFLDPNAMSIFDAVHSEEEERWVTLGIDRAGTLLVMKSHYDFSKAERGKFYRKGARLQLSIYLDSQLQQRLERIAQKNGQDLGDVVSTLLAKEVELLEELT